jgi:hypothetical protein
MKGHRSAIKEGNVRGQLEGFPQLMGGHDDGLAFVERLAQQALQDRDGAVVECGGGRQDSLGVAARDGRRWHAARKLADETVFDTLEAGALQPSTPISGIGEA